MTRIPCYDKEGNTIKSLTQWDKNQSVYIDDLENGSLPRVHFALGSNAKESKEYKDNVKFDGKKIKITIPNELLKTYAEMYLFLYYGDVESEEPLTTKYMVKIPITKKPQPDDYIYEDNVDYLSIYKLKLELSLILDNAANYAAESRANKESAETAAREAAGSAQEARNILSDVNAAGANQIQMIETAGAEQTNAAKAEIDAKGKQTLDSIPEDYTGLQTEVDGLKSDLGEVEDVLFTKETALIYDVQGTDFPNNGYINNQGTVPSSTDTNWKNTEFVEVEEGDRIEGHLALGLTDVVCSVACYDINKTFMLDDSLLRMLDGEYIVPEGVHYVRFCHASTYSSDNFVKIYSKINKNILKTIKNKVNLICIGDSYGIQNTDGDIEKFYWEYLRDGLGLEEGTDFFHKYRIGAGMGNGGYLEQIQLLDNSVTDKESITDILLCGGWNDSNTQNTGGTDTEFWNGAETFFAYIKEKYPNARVSIGHISWGRLGEGMRDQLNLSLARYKEMANKYGCRFLTNMESVLHIYPTEYWQSDSSHPNNEGHKLLGRHIVSAFISGSADVLYDSEISDFVTWGQALETIGKIYSEVNNNITRVWSASENGLIAINGFTNNGITPNGATEYGIAKITTKYFRGYRHHTFATTGCIILANGKYYHGSVRLRFDGDMVYARFYVPHDGLNNWLGNLTNIYIQDFDLSVATMKS